MRSSAPAATSELAKTTLRSVLGKAELDTLLSEREHLNEDLQRIIDEQTEPWGIKVVTVEIEDVGIPQDMQRAMARQAEAERDRRAMVINAEAESQAAARLAEAADLLSDNPAALQLRYLQTLADVGKGEGSTVCCRCRSTSSAPSLGASGTAGAVTGRLSFRSTDRRSPARKASSRLGSTRSSRGGCAERVRRKGT
jgi:regulator of protease activity HflC (stomatin/prohibitin superfamily)